jgi:hypothetical protein
MLLSGQQRRLDDAAGLACLTATVRADGLVLVRGREWPAVGSWDGPGGGEGGPGGQCRSRRLGAGSSSRAVGAGVTPVVCHSWGTRAGAEPRLCAMAGVRTPAMCPHWCWQASQVPQRTNAPWGSRASQVPQRRCQKSTRPSGLDIPVIPPYRAHDPIQERRTPLKAPSPAGDGPPPGTSSPIVGPTLAL